MRKISVGNSWASKRYEVAKLLIERHPIFFSDKNNKDSCIRKSLELSAREYRSLGKRKKAAILAQRLINMGIRKDNIISIIDEGDMPFWRYLLRRIGRHI